MLPLRFAMVTTFYPPYSAGPDGLQVRRLARALASRGHSVDVIHDTDAYRLLTGHVPEIPVDEDGIRVHRLRSTTKFMSSLSVQQFGRPTAHKERLHELLDGRYDVIHYHNVSLIGGPGVWRVGTGIKLHTAHDFWLCCPGHTLWRDNKELCTGKRCIRCVIRQGRPPQMWRLTRRIQRNVDNVDRFLVPSQAAADIHKSFGFSYPMEVVPDFSPGGEPRLQTAKAVESDARPYFFCAAPLDNIQGLQDVVPLFTDDLEADLVIAGIGTDEARLRWLAKDHRNVIFKGRQSAEEIADLRRGALAVIAPHKGYSVFPHPVMDAFRDGIPVLTRNIGSHREIIETTGGGHVFSTPSELRSHLHMLLNDPGYAAELGRRAFSGFARFWREDVAIEAYFDVIRRVAEEREMADLLTKLDEKPALLAT